ncbi:hypothetical protein BD413DRAFT_495714 [Trametes elegans]|nr:hypothetical protein BD413DRAFT_495714 [Trametes elegans]
MASAASTSNRKRLRYESPEDEKPFTNHPTLYFDDGNAILRAGRTLFCVHKSLLSKHSIVLGELLERPHERFRGLVHVVMEESAEEVEALLNVVYDGLRVDIQELTVETFPTLANVLRMARRYRIDRPCADIIARIRSEWPATLVQHNAKQSEASARLFQLYSVAGQPQEERKQEEDIIVHPASVIALLRECGYNDPDVLFPLFYALSRATWQFGGPTLGHNLAALAPADVERLVVGIERLRASHAAFAVVVPAFDPSPTNPPHFCQSGATQLWAMNLQRLLPNAPRRAREPLEEWREVIQQVDAHHRQYQICALCERSIMSKLESFRQGLWASLPTFFELS